MLKTTEELKRMTHRELFELSSQFTREDLKRGYKKLALRYHPDKLTLNSLSEEERLIFLKGGYMGAFQYIFNVYELLNKPFDEESMESYQYKSGRDFAQYAARGFGGWTPPQSVELTIRRFHEIQDELLKNNRYGIKHFTAKERLARIVGGILSNQLSYSDISYLSISQMRCLLNPHTWDLIDNGFFYPNEIKKFSDSFCDKISTLTISKLVRSGHLTLDQVKQIKNDDRLVLNSPYIYSICRERNDLISTIVNLQNNSPFLKLLFDLDLRSLDTIYQQGLVEFVIAGRITIDHFKEFNAIELLMIGSGIHSPADVRQIPKNKRAYLTQPDILHLIFPYGYKDTECTNLLARTPANLAVAQNHYSVYSLLDLDEKRLSFISNNVRKILKYNITIQALSALPDETIVEINQELRSIANDAARERVSHEDGVPSEVEKRYAPVFERIVSLSMSMSIQSETERPKLLMPVDNNSAITALPSNHVLSQKELKMKQQYFILANLFQKNSEHLSSLISKSINQESETSSLNMSNYSNLTIFSDSKNNASGKTNEESKENMQNGNQNTGENLCTIC